MQAITSYAPSNIALIKYWGKLDAAQNLPAVGSLSMTLNGLGTTTIISESEKGTDSFSLDGVLQDGESLRKIVGFLQLMREKAGKHVFCHVESKNNFPTASGLASSASGFAALALAGTRFFGLELSLQELAALARRGSASAARSIVGGYVYMRTGSHRSKPAHIEKVLPPEDFELAMLIVQCTHAAKQISSRQGMQHTAQTSPFYPAWVDTHQTDLDVALHALRHGDLDTLGKSMEHSTLKMHATMLSSQPGFWYFLPTTITCMNRVVELRQQGYSCYFTMDAGPHVKVLCNKDDAAVLAKQFETIPGVLKIMISGPASS